jgi:hypothetical protein
MSIHPQELNQFIALMHGSGETAHVDPAFAAPAVI